MEELENLRKNIEAGNYEEALAIVNELEEMIKPKQIRKQALALVVEEATHL